MTQPETPAPDAAAMAEAASPPSGDVRVKLFARTDVGQVREHNEDNFLVADLTRRQRGLLEANRTTPIGPHGAVFAVCDGMGGAAAGEVASQLAVDILFEKMAPPPSADGFDKAPLTRDDLARRLVRAVEAAGQRIFQEAKADRTRRGMGTTVTAAALVDDHLFLAQVGDSRGYILRSDQLVQVTRDQSLVNQLIEAGQLTEEEAETFEHNNIILQALGTSDTVQVDLTFVELLRGDTLLLCSDGLSGMVRFDDIKEILRSSSDPMEVCKALTERANQAGGHDNVTVIVVHFDGERLRGHDSTGTPLKYRKYTLPEESTEPAEPAGGSLRSPPIGNASGGVPANIYSAPSLPANPADPSGPQVATPASAPPSSGWQEPGSAPLYPEERIDIPGTHVPAFVVVLLVVGVVALLSGTAFLLLR